MNVGIVGSRSFTNYDVLKKSMNSILKDEKNITIVSGGAKGTDSLGEAYALDINVNTLIYKPEWKIYGKRAGFIRNHKIIDNSDKIIAYWDNYSKGTEHTINEALKKNVEVTVLNYHYLSLKELKTDKEKYNYLINNNVKNYTIWLDNDMTFLTFNKRENYYNDEETIDFDDFLGDSKGVIILLDLLGLYWSYV